MEQGFKTVRQLKKALASNSSEKEAALSFIYKKYRDKCMAALLSRNQNKEDAKDIFQNMILEIDRKCLESFKKNDFEVLGAYLRQSCVNMQSNEFRLRKRMPLTVIENPEARNILSSKKEEFEDFNNTLVQKAWDKVWDKVGERCKKILLMRMRNYSHKEIAEDLGRTEQRIKNSFLECKKKLKNIMKKNPGLMGTIVGI